MKKVVNILLGAILGLVAGGISVGKLYKKIVGNREEKIDKFKRYYNMLNQWLILSQQNKPLSQYFIDSGYRSIAIYGMGEMGQRLYCQTANYNRVQQQIKIPSDTYQTARSCL